MSLSCLLGHRWRSCRCEKCEARVETMLEAGMPCGFRHTWSVCARCGAKKEPW